MIYQLITGTQTVIYLGDNCIQNFHLGRYIVGYTVKSLVLQQPRSGAVKCDFPRYIRRYTSPYENFEYCNSHSNALLQFSLESERFKPHKAAHHPPECDIVVTSECFRQYITGYTGLKFLTLSNQTSGYKSKCIRLRNKPLSV